MLKGSRSALINLLSFYLTTIVLVAVSLAMPRAWQPWFVVGLLIAALWLGLYYWGRHCLSCGHLTKKRISPSYPIRLDHGEHVVESRTCPCGVRWYRKIYRMTEHGLTGWVDRRWQKEVWKTDR